MKSIHKTCLTSVNSSNSILSEYYNQCDPCTTTCRAGATGARGDTFKI